MSTSAGKFALAYDTKFKASTKGFSHNEIPLFKAMHSTLISLGGPFDVEEYHGTSHQVTFSGNGSFARTNARCELSDLMIITFSKVTRTAKLTYLQAKSERGKVSSVSNHKFAANLEQWFLLKQRPQIAGIGGFNPPQDLLSNALLPSIGSFGFFYKDVAGDFQTFYAAANYLHPPSVYSQKNGKLRALGPCKVKNVSGYAECLAACGNFAFAKSLYSLKIGTPVDSSAGQAISIRNWLASNLRIKIEESQQIDRRPLLAQELVEVLSPEIEVPATGEFGAKHFIIIKSDSEPE